MSKKPAKVIDMKSETPRAAQPTNEGIEVKGTVSKSFLELIVILKPDTKPDADPTLVNFQDQIKKCKAAVQRVRIMYYVPVSNDTKQARETFVLSKANCKYYLVVDLNVKKQAFPSTFVADRLKEIQNLEKALETLRFSNIKRKAPNSYQPDQLKMTEKGLKDR